MKKNRSMLYTFSYDTTSRSEKSREKMNDEMCEERKEDKWKM